MRGATCIPCLLVLAAAGWGGDGGNDRSVSCPDFEACGREDGGAVLRLSK